MTQLALRLPPKPAFEHTIVGTTWPCKLEAYEALDGLDRWQQTRINGKTFRRVAGDRPDEKLFWVRNRPVGLKDHFPLSDAVLFALLGELVPRTPRGYEDVSLSMLAATYPMLMEHQGVILQEDSIQLRQEVGDHEPNSWFVPATRGGDFSPGQMVREADGTPKLYEAGTFVLRVSPRGRDQAGAFYTPDVLAECLTHHTLNERLTGLSADEILKLTVCDPCMGANATFLVQASVQLAQAYLERKQRELGAHIPSDEYLFELRKVQQHFIANQCHGVDLDPVAVMVAEMCLRLSVLP